MGKTWKLDLNIGDVDDEAHEAAGQGLFLASEHILQVSRTRVPIAQDGGTLERSGVASVDRKSLQAAVSYDTPYAVVQHEELTYQHAPGRQAKYLESALTGERDVALQIIAAQIRRALGT